MKRISSRKQASSGFSLLEVLIAVVVLATGLLALAALQASLARNAADAKARSRVVTLLSNELDALRSTPGGYDALAALVAGGAVTTTTTAGADCTVANPDSVTAAGCDAAVGGLSVKRTIREFSASGGSFVEANPGAPTDAQFLLVNFEASWTDATGETRKVDQATVLSALALQSNSPLVSYDPDGFDPAKPKVRQDTPFEEGMIPIAIGDGRETAATNPKPIVVGTNNTVVETKFNVFTYRAEGAGTLIQQRVETTVIGCKCNTATAANLGPVYSQNFRPTYWNGTRYATPELLDAAARPAPAGPAAVDPSVAPQSELCTDCCRDHHDAATDEIKFDPFRTDSHDHYLRSGANLTLAKTGEYNESCRLIRVDGLWRVATDFKVDHVGYVATGPAESSQVPNSGHADFYEKFVVDALRDRFADGDATWMDFSKRYDEPARLLNDSPLDKSPLSNSDNRIEIEADPADLRYLHTRGLLIDNIEESAQKTIDNALENCAKTGDQKVECVLSHIPFTTINITELARYNESDATVIDVIDGGVNFNDPLIIQGMVTGRTTAQTGKEARSNVKFKTSNTALATIEAIDPEDRAIWLPEPTDALPTPVNSDEQAYIAVNLNDNLQGATFYGKLTLSTPTMTDGNQTNDPGMRWRIGDGYRYPCGATTNASGATAAPCQTNSPLGPGVPFSLIVSGYNYWADSVDETSLTCPNANNKDGYGTITRKQFGQGRLCRRYKVTSAAVNGAGGRGANGINVTAFTGSAAQGKSEETTIRFDGSDGSHVKPNEQVDVLFQWVEDVQPNLVSCTYNNLNSTKVNSVEWTSACDL